MQISSEPTFVRDHWVTMSLFRKSLCSHRDDWLGGDLGFAGFTSNRLVETDLPAVLTIENPQASLQISAINETKPAVASPLCTIRFSTNGQSMFAVHGKKVYQFLPSDGASPVQIREPVCISVPPRDIIEIR